MSVCSTLLYDLFRLDALLYNQKHFNYLVKSRLFIISKTKFIEILLWNNSLVGISFLNRYYARSENLWQDGFLLDFLQKKTIDAWVRNFVIYTGFLFSERLVFDTVVRLYLDNLIWPAHNNSLFEISNVSEMLGYVVFVLVSIFFIMFTVYLLLNF